MTNPTEGIEELVLRLAEELDGRRYGKYRGVVKANDDPEGRGRLRLLVPSVLGQAESEWALPCLPFGGKSQQGLFMVPDVDSHVWVEFEEGDIDRPIWAGVYWQKAQPEQGAETDRDQPPWRRRLRTPGGHVLELDDTPGEEKIRLEHKAGAELHIDEQGTMRLEDAAGSSLILDVAGQQVVLRDSHRNSLTLSPTGVLLEDTNGNSLETHAGGISLNTHGRILLTASQVELGGEGGEPVICGQRFITQFMTHRHTSAPIVGGPTSPPVPQGEISTLSTMVRTK